MLIRCNIIPRDSITFGFMSHESMLYDFAQVTGQQNSLSRPFQLALGFTIVPYGTHFSYHQKFIIDPMQLNT